jgi:hypothetical protein
LGLLCLCVTCRALYGRMVDLTKFMLGHMSTQDLWKFISEDGGSNSVEFLKRLGSRASTGDTYTMHADSLCEPGAAAETIGRLDAHGPALIRWGLSPSGGSPYYHVECCRLAACCL